MIMYTSIKMLNTRIVSKTGTDFANLFYNVPEPLRTTKTEGEAVGKLKFEVYVEGMLFFSKELNFYGAGSSEPFGKIDINNLGEGEYRYRVEETLVRIEKSTYGKKTIAKNEMSGSFLISDSINAPRHQYRGQTDSVLGC